MDDPQPRLRGDRSTIEISRRTRQDLKRLKNDEDPDSKYDAFLPKLVRDRKILGPEGVDGLIRTLNRISRSESVRSELRRFIYRLELKARAVPRVEME